MRTNPVYRRETMVSARSFRLTLVMLVFNGILAFVALLNMYSTLEQVKQTAEMQYSSFLDLYIFVSVLEFVMVLFIMPALTAGSISGERERRTLDIMLTTKLTPAQIVTGKLMAALGSMGLMVVSSFPVLALVFVYGGVTFPDIALLLLSYLAAALYVGAIGICCSSACGKSTLSTVAAYVAVALVVAGTYAVNWISVYLGQVRADSAAGLFAEAQGAPGAFGWLLLFNPTASFLMIMQRLAGGEQSWFALNRLTGMTGVPDPRFWIGGSLLIELLMALVFTAAAVGMLTPENDSGRHGHLPHGE